MPSSKQNAKRSAWDAFAKYVKYRDAIEATGFFTNGRCISCGALIRVLGNDAGHFVPGRTGAVLFEEHNCHLQCAKCNRFLNGAWVAYEKALIEKYGVEEVERLKALSGQTVKRTDDDYREIAKYYRQKTKELIGGKR